ncbi:MAG: hypothetical protein AAF423_09800 [Pseudomonadota bacterium]
MKFVFVALFWWTLCVSANTASAQQPLLSDTEIKKLTILADHFKDDIINESYSHFRSRYSLIFSNEYYFRDHPEIYKGLLAPGEDGKIDVDGHRLIRAGIQYFAGNGVPQDMEKAAILLGAAFSLSGSNSERFPKPSTKMIEAVAFAAEASHAKYIAENGKESIYGPMIEYLAAIGMRADGQKSYIANGYSVRFDPLPPGNYDVLYTKKISAQNEIKFFKEASNCTEERLKREISPWNPELCEAAGKEIAVAERGFQLASSAYDAEEFKRRSWDLSQQTTNWPVMVAVGFFALAIATADPKYADPNALEKHEKQRQQSLQNQLNSTYAHAEALRVLP